MARVHTVERSLKQHTCGRCGFTIPKGAGYRYAQPGFRNRQKLIRCLNVQCRFRQSELTTSKMSAVYAAVENAEEQISQWDGEESSDLESIMSECANEVRTVAEEYASAAEAMGGAGETLQGKADGLESWADELEGVDFEDKPEEPAKCAHDGGNPDHLAKPGEDYCGPACEKCDKTDAPADEVCAGLCSVASVEVEEDGLDDWQRTCRDACTELLGNVPEE